MRSERSRPDPVNHLDGRSVHLDHALMTDPDLGRLLLEAHRAMGSQLVGILAERGYPDARPGHAAVFLHIDRRSGTRLTDLARRARMSKQGMMLLVDDLEQRGYVRRVGDPEDGRAKVVRLTAKGRRYVGEARRVTAAIESRTRRELGDRRYETLRSALEELVTSSGDEET
jgi:DNA-binding MarR family transcriptional regulator